MALAVSVLMIIVFQMIAQVVLESGRFAVSSRLERITVVYPGEGGSISQDVLDEIKNNPAVSVLLGYEEKGLSDSYIEIKGNSTINQSQNLKNKYWDESFNKWFEGPEDPNYVYLEINPETIRILNMQGEPPQELNL